MSYLQRAYCSCSGGLTPRYCLEVHLGGRHTYAFISVTLPHVAPTANLEMMAFMEVMMPAQGFNITYMCSKVVCSQQVPVSAGISFGACCCLGLSCSGKQVCEVPSACACGQTSIGWQHTWYTMPIQFPVIAHPVPLPCHQMAEHSCIAQYQNSHIRV